MSDPLKSLRWAYAPADQRWHVLPDGGRAGPEARCGQSLPSGGQSYPEPYRLTCPACAGVVRAVGDSRAQRGRLWVPCTRLDTGAAHTLIVAHEWDAAWTIHAPATVRLDAAEMVFACTAVLMRSAQVLHRARQVRQRAGQGDTR